MLVLYGTETGCARELAERVGREAAQRRITPRVVGMDDYDIGELPEEEVVVCVCSTTGDGDVPSNMTAFWKFLMRRDLTAARSASGRGALAGVKFAVFGLGDSSYAQFNVVARKLHARLEQLGATVMHSLTLGDDQSPFGLAGDIDLWLTALWESILRIKPLPDGFMIDDSSKLPTLCHRVVMMDEANVVPSTTAQKTKFYKPPRGSRPTPDGMPHLCTTMRNTRMTSEDWHQDVRHIVLSPAPGEENSHQLEYDAGDIAVVYPRNVFDVDSFAQLMGFNPDSVFSLKSCGGGGSSNILTLFPTPCTVRQALTCYLDVLGTPRRYAVEMLSHFATDPVEKDKLMEIGARRDGVDLYHSYLKREKRGFVELFADFTSCRPPFEWLVHIVPLLQPRLSPGNDLGDKVAGDNNVRLFVKRGRIRPAPAGTPELLIGPGTGIAPIMSLLQHRFALRRGSSECADQVVQDMVFFGCRHRSKDFLFREELSRMCDTKSLSSHGGGATLNENIDDKVSGSEDEMSPDPAQLYVAFSRDQPQKVYVQHKLAEQADKVWALLDPSRGNGRVVISGSSKRMPQDVLAVLKRIAILKGKLSQQEADRFFRTLQRRGKYVLEAW
eukprot:g1210.t1